MLYEVITADEPCLLGDGNEAARRNVSLVGAVPAQQRLGSHDAPAGDLDQGLVVQAKLLVDQRLAQPAFYGQALLGRTGQLIGEEAVAGPAFGLGAIP